MGRVGVWGSFTFPAQLGWGWEVVWGRHHWSTTQRSERVTRATVQSQPALEARALRQGTVSSTPPPMCPLALADS